MTRKVKTKLSPFAADVTFPKHTELLYVNHLDFESLATPMDLKSCCEGQLPSPSTVTSDGKEGGKVPGISITSR